MKFDGRGSAGTLATGSADVLDGVISPYFITSGSDKRIRPDFAASRADRSGGKMIWTRMRRTPGEDRNLHSAWSIRSWPERSRNGLEHNPEMFPSSRTIPASKSRPGASPIPALASGNLPSLPPPPRRKKSSAMPARCTRSRGSVPRLRCTSHCRDLSRKASGGIDEIKSFASRYRVRPGSINPNLFHRINATNTALLEIPTRLFPRISPCGSYPRRA